MCLVALTSLLKPRDSAISAAGLVYTLQCASGLECRPFLQEPPEELESEQHGTLAALLLPEGFPSCQPVLSS